MKNNTKEPKLSLQEMASNIAKKYPNETSEYIKKLLKDTNSNRNTKNSN